MQRSIVDDVSTVQVWKGQNKTIEENAEKTGCEKAENGYNEYRVPQQLQEWRKVLHVLDFESEWKYPK